MKRIAFVGTVGAGKTTLFNALQGDYTLAKKNTRPWNLLLMAILIHRVNILAIPAGITP